MSGYKSLPFVANDNTELNSRSACTLLLLGSIFFGNIYGRFTTPLAIILLPFFSIYLRSIRFDWMACIPVAACIPVIFQALNGYPPQKQDISVYYGFVYASMILLCMGKAILDDGLILLGLVGGGLFISLVMVLKGVTNFSYGMDFYSIKNIMETPLGSSNYLAVFILFSFTTALFHGRYFISSILAFAIIITLSRVGYAMLFLTVIVWLLVTKVNIMPKWRIVLSRVAYVLLAVTLLLLYANKDALPFSLAIRVGLWHEAVQQFFSFPFFGAPRSQYVHIFQGLAWDAHNSILNLLILVGVVGAAIYSYFLYFAIMTFKTLSASSLLWKSVYIAVIISLVWSLFEVVLLTPAYDVLIALLLCFARARQRALSNEIMIGRTQL